MRKALGILLVLGLLSGSALATRPEWGSRVLGMGGAGVALVDDASGAYWNPAALMRLEGKELVLDATLRGGEFTDADFALGLMEYAPQVSAAGGLLLTRASNTQGDATGQAYSFSYIYSREARPGLIIGGSMGRTWANAKGQEASKGKGWFADLGMLYELTPYFSVGLVAQDITGSKIKWSPEQGEDWETRAGVNLRPGMALNFSAFSLAVDLHDALANLGPTSLRMGSEVRFFNLLALRVGGEADLEGKRIVTAGLGLKNSEWRLDYSVRGNRSQGAWNLAHQASLAYRF